MTVAVVIAYKDMGCPHRAASFEVVRGFYTDLGFDVIVEGGDENFTRASGINGAIARTDATVIVQSDPDSLVTPAQLEAGIALAEQEDGLVTPFERYLYVNEQVTDEILRGDRGLFNVRPIDCDESGLGGVGNVAIFSRSTWQTVGGFDEGMGLWAGDDAAFRYASDAFCQHLRRLPGDMIHLWHPRMAESVPGHPGYVKQFSVLEQYRDAAAVGDEAVRDLVRTRRTHALA